jgi:hypothetical protein
MPTAFDHIAITESELAPFIRHPNQAGRAHGLLHQQQCAWELLRNGYSSLQRVRTRTFEFDEFLIKVQFNPGRITSTSAKVDPHSIRERKCFLCTDNLPPAQRGIARDGDYLLLCNPFPIFPEHFTISCTRHVPQRILSSFGTFLGFARDLGDRYTVFYNGPKCGASAPDHLHFQAGNRAFVPLDAEYETIREKRSATLMETDSVRVYAISGCLRHFFAVESANPASLQGVFEELYAILHEAGAGDEEPMLNILGFYQQGEWRILFFPRARHRPAFYFTDGDAQLLISPASVELAGVCTTPREQDFEKVTRDHIVQMFDEVCISRDDFCEMAGRLAERLADLRPR